MDSASTSPIMDLTSFCTRLRATIWHTAKSMKCLQAIPVLQGADPLEIGISGRVWGLKPGYDC
jgi:hypothetical protein